MTLLFICGSWQAQASDALIKAAKKNDIAQVKAELDGGANVEYMNKTGFTALILASTFGHLETVQLLVEQGADINAASKHGMTPIASAAQSRHDTAMVTQFLAENGAALVGEFGEWKMAPLQLAIMNHNTASALVLIDAGADLTAVDKVGDPSLHGAIYQEDDKVLRALLQKNVDLFFVNNNKKNAVQFAKKWNKDKFAMPIILEFYPDICSKTDC